MFIIIKDNRNIYKHNIKDYFLYKGIEIYLKNNRYYINLKENYYFSDNTKSNLLEYKKYEILNNQTFYSIYLYVYENDKGIEDFQLYENQKILIANNKKTNIICSDPYLKDYYLYLSDGYIKSNYEVFVNGLNYNGDYLNDGDIIEYLGIKIIYFHEYLYINHFQTIIRLKPYQVNETLIHYNDSFNIPSYRIKNKLLELKIEPLKEFIAPKKNSFHDFIKQIIPNIIMSLSMSALAGVSLYSSIQNNQPGYSRINYLLMPISMFLTSILVPVGFYIYETSKYKKDYRNNKLEYIDYLTKYEAELENNIKSYVDSYNRRYFDFNSIQDQLFIVNKKDDDFLNISLGKITIHKELSYKYTNDIDIDNTINKIKDRLNNIKDFPLFLNIKENKIISIVCKPSDKKYLFHKFLLELAYKHHFEELNIGVYSNDLNNFNDIFNLPHLFINDKRMTLSCDKQIQDLNQMKLEKPLILFVYDSIYFNFTNENIYVIYLSDDINNIYKNSDCIIEYFNNKAYLYKEDKLEFNIVNNDIPFKEYFNYLARFRQFKNSDKDLHFKDIFDLDIKKNYLSNNRTLMADFAYRNGELLSFDLHESKQGPHGLIGGCTGSGKSELIVSLLLSLCIRYSPEYLNIVLIDYKGGGIKESLSYKNMVLPHIIASISNLENNSLQRLIICLNNECKLRQSLFKSLSKLTNSSIMNLDDYLNEYDDKYGLRKLAHLLIVVDEFAELKKENPEQIKELISLSRIGRSLGVHLILATQKPNGVIDDEIWSNSHFKIALKVFDEKDSMDIIKSKDAAYLNKAGSFLLRVDDSLIQAQSIYSKHDYYDNDPYKISLLDNRLECSKTYKYQKNKGISECSIYIQKILDACEELKIRVDKLDYLPATNKARKALTSGDCFVFGESDDYLHSKRSLLAYGLKENILLFSTRFNEMNSYLNTLNEFKRQCVVIGSRRYAGAYISDTVLYDEQEEIHYLFDYLLNNKNHNLTLVIEDISCLLSYDDSYLEMICKLARRSDTLNINLFIISSNSQLSYKLINYFSTRILIHINDKSDISAFYGMRSNYEGNSFYFKKEPISMIPVKIENYMESKPLCKPIIKRIPEQIPPCVENDQYLIGYDLVSKEKVFADKNCVVLSLDEKLLNSYKNAYKDINTYVYMHSLKLNNNDDILWLGPGIFSQHLFIASNKCDLKTEEGIYLCKGNKQTIRCINYA